jgi:hypothetical protein
MVHFPPFCFAITKSFTVKTEWDVQRYADRLTPRNSGQNEAFETALHLSYPPIYKPPEIASVPMLVTDRHNNAVLWYLPNLLTPRRHVS